MLILLWTENQCSVLAAGQHSMHDRVETSVQTLLRADERLTTCFRYSFACLHSELL